MQRPEEVFTDWFTGQEVKDGAEFTVTAKLLAALVAQAFEAVTVILPLALPAVAVKDVVPCPDVIDQPVGTAHV